MGLVAAPEFRIKYKHAAQLDFRSSRIWPIGSIGTDRGRSGGIADSAPLECALLFAPEIGISQA